jgi:CO/xanthine dehydrogenase Mo-binding subunit
MFPDERGKPTNAPAGHSRLCNLGVEVLPRERQVCPRSRPSIASIILFSAVTAFSNPVCGGNGVIESFAAALTMAKRGDCALGEGHVVAGSRRIELAKLAQLAESNGTKLSGQGRASGTPRPVAFNVQGFEIAVHRRYGEVRILRSSHAADAGTVINPMQCRGQIEGGVVQAIGAAIYEHLQIDSGGRVCNPTFRGYHIPALADAPLIEVHFAQTFDRIGPLGAKSMSESPYNPVAAALANAIRDATGVRLFETPFTADHVYLSRRDDSCKGGKQPNESMFVPQSGVSSVGHSTDRPECQPTTCFGEDAS